MGLDDDDIRLWCDRLIARRPDTAVRQRHDDRHRQPRIRRGRRGRRTRRAVRVPRYNPMLLCRKTGRRIIPFFFGSSRNIQVAAKPWFRRIGTLRRRTCGDISAERNPEGDREAPTNRRYAAAVEEYHG
ncbi:hypothetical protein BTHE_1960 [Bifidobacterium thermophilum]|nr:hypothetical protein BTHE_1960 [Bifidobacterium thermophilum]